MNAFTYMFYIVLIMKSCKIQFYGSLFLNECQCVKLVNVSHWPREFFYLICTKRMHISNSEVISASKFFQKLFLIFNFFFFELYY